MSEWEQKAAETALPVSQAGALTRYGVMRAAGVAAGASYLLPKAVHGEFLKIKAVGVELDYNISFDAAVTLVKDVLSPIGATVTTAGDTLSSGQDAQEPVPHYDGDIYLNVVAASDAGYVVVRCASHVEKT